MKVSGIYGWRNTENGKWYVGQSIDVNRRESDHLTKLRANKHSNTYLQSSWNIHKECSFEFRILEICHEEMLDIREIAWISYYKSDQRDFGYNIKSGGLRSAHSEETKKKIGIASKARKRKPHSEETKLRISKAKIGKKLKPFSIEHKRKMSEKAKIRESKKKTLLESKNFTIN